VNGLASDHPILELSLQDARQLDEGHEIFVVGYPAFDPRNPADTQQKVFDGKYGVKRLQPGALHGRVNTASFGNIVPAAAHDCSTLGGNSGSAVFDLSTGQVLALHFGGQYHRRNYAVPSHAMHRKREASTPAGSARRDGNNNGPMSVPPGSGAGDDTLLALERQFEILAREFSILLSTPANQKGKAKGVLGSDTGPANRVPLANEATDETTSLTSQGQND
jgi:hypothetical protein